MMFGGAASLTSARDLVEDLPDLVALIEPLLFVRRALREQIVILHRRLLAMATRFISA